MGSWLARLASGLLFGAMHVGNDNVSALGIANNAAAGVFLTAVLLLKERSEPDWLTGGAFGIKGSAIDLAFPSLPVASCCYWPGAAAALCSLCGGAWAEIIAACVRLPPCRCCS